MKGTVDHEKLSIYHLVVIAEDRGPDSRASEATVVVHVDDTNDNSPMIVVNTLNSPVSGSGSTGVTEDAPVGTFVAHVTVSDADAGANGRFNCSLNSNSFRLVMKYPTEYQVSWGHMSGFQNVSGVLPLWTPYPLPQSLTAIMMMTRC